jgi:hypothetical protein
MRKARTSRMRVSRIKEGGDKGDNVHFSHDLLPIPLAHAFKVEFFPRKYLKRGWWSASCGQEFV